MPELPDVEGFRRQLARRLPGRRVRRVDVPDAGVLRNTTAAKLSRRLAGRRFGQPRRHGKWLILPTDGPALVVHSGMTGHPHYAPGGNDVERLDRVVVTLDQGQLRYTDQRKLRGSGWPRTSRPSATSSTTRARTRSASTCVRSASDCAAGAGRSSRR